MAGGHWFVPSAPTLIALVALLFALVGLPAIVQSLGGDLGLLRSYTPWILSLVLISYLLYPRQK